jgi:HD superfamily phosphohydrolase
MFKKTDEIKVMRDPVHEYIHIEYQVIWDAINSKEFQRMRRIHQMGTSYLVYHTAEHSRFSHCLGVYEITRRMCTEVKDIQEYLSEDEKIQVMLAGLSGDERTKGAIMTPFASQRWIRLQRLQQEQRQ